MKQLSKILLRALILTVMLVLTISGVNAQGDSAIRFVHVIPDAVPVDIYVNGTLAVKGLEYGEDSTYINVAAGNHTVTVTPAGIATTLWEQSISVAAGDAATFIASNGAVPQFARFDDNLNATGFGASRLLLIHALAGGQAIDVQLAEPVSLNGVIQDAGTVIAGGLEYANSFGAFDLPAQTYVVNVLPNGGSVLDVIVGSVPFSLNSGTSYMAVIYGSADNPQATLLSAPTTASADGGLLRFVHGIVGGPTIDVYANGTLVAAGLTPDNPTAHIAVSAGEQEIAYVVANSDGALASINVTVAAGSVQTVAALLSGDEVTLSAFTDDLSGINESTAVASVLNTIDGSTITIELSNGTVLSNETPAGETSAATAFAATSSSSSLTLNFDEGSGTLDGGSQTFYGGVYYNIIVLDGNAFSPPRFVIATTSISRGLASAPGASEATIAVGSAATEAAPQQEENTAPEQETSVPIVISTDEEVIVGEIGLDPSANLQLRQYPRTDAMSLGLAPSGTFLIINGREGAPVALVEGEAPPAEAATFVDPVTLLLDEDEDLDPSQTWLSVTFNTPDGGTIVAWVLAQYLIVTDDEGLADLRDLGTVAGNIAGETANTEITPPATPEDIITASVTNLSVDANLNVRRTATIDGEVLARLPLDTVIELLGFIDTSILVTDAEWAFVAYNPPEGGVVTGWVSTLFLNYQWNGENTDIEELLERELIGVVDADTIGGISAGAPTVSVPTPDPLEDAYLGEILLDTGANLQFRRNPDATSESLNLVPSGTQLIVDARTSDGDWLRATYEGEVGWVSSQPVRITFNGDFIEDISEIPVASSDN